MLTTSKDHAGSNVEGVALAAKRRKYIISTDSRIVDIRLTKISHIALTDAELGQMEEGSKQQLLAWYSYSSLVWCLKGTMVCFFMRMTAGVASRKSVVWIGYACIVTYVAVELTVSPLQYLPCCPRRVLTHSIHRSLSVAGLTAAISKSSLTLAVSQPWTLGLIIRHISLNPS